MGPNNGTRRKALRAFEEVQEQLQTDRTRKKAENTSWKRRYLSWVQQEERVCRWRRKKCHTEGLLETKAGWGGNAR